MIRQFLPVKDASVYEEFPTRNTGLDEILEFGKTETGAYAVRSMLAFDFTTIRNTLLPSGAVCILRLQTALAERLPQNQAIVVGSYTGSWIEGTGYFYQDIYQEPDGLTWNGLSGSYTPAVAYTASIPWTDIAIDVTSLVSASTTTGLVIQFPSASEASIGNTGNVRVFSRNTHTIYAPILEVRWTDQVYATGSLATSENKHIHVFPHSLQSAYSQNETAHVELTVREKYPLKTFTNYLNPFVNSLYLPSASYFSVIDDATNFSVIPFSPQSAVHQSASGSYCTFKIENMYPRRFYRMAFKLVYASGEERVIDDSFLFKVR